MSWLPLNSNFWSATTAAESGLWTSFAVVWVEVTAWISLISVCLGSLRANAGGAISAGPLGGCMAGGITTGLKRLIEFACWLPGMPLIIGSLSLGAPCNKRLDEAFASFTCSKFCYTCDRPAVWTAWLPVNGPRLAKVLRLSGLNYISAIYDVAPPPKSSYWELIIANWSLLTYFNWISIVSNELIVFILRIC